MVAMTLPVARDLAGVGIRVCTIAPGIVDTPMLATLSDEIRARLEDNVPFPKRLGRPAEFAQLAVSIIEHDYLNGEVIRMDGALRMPPRRPQLALMPLGILLRDCARTRMLGSEYTAARRTRWQSGAR